MKPQSQILPSQDNFTIKDPYFLCGVLMFLVNRMADLHFNFPIGDLLFPLLVYFMANKTNIITRFFQCPGSILATLLMCWILLSNIYNGTPPLAQARQGYATITLFLPVFFFILTENRKPIMSYIIGGIVGFGLYFIILSGISLADGVIARGLRGDQPTPVIALAIYALLHKNMSRPIRIVLLASAVTSTLIGVAIASRGPLVALAITGLLYIAIRTLPKPRIIIVVSLLGALVAHYFWSMAVGSSFDAVANASMESISNLQRAAAIDFCRKVLEDHAFMGIDMENFRIMFNHYFMSISGFTREVDYVSSPHNSFLEYSVFFGYPAGILFILTVARIVYGGITSPAIARSLFIALVVAGVIRMGAFYGFSGWLRLEWFAAIFPLYYSYQLRIPTRQINPFRTGTAVS